MRTLVVVAIFGTASWLLVQRLTADEPDDALHFGGLRWDVYSEEAVAAAREAGRGVVVFATADW